MGSHQFSWVKMLLPTPWTLEAGLGSELLSSLGASISHNSTTGHVVLGSPIRSNEYVTAFAERSIEEARRILKREAHFQRPSPGQRLHRCS